MRGRVSIAGLMGAIVVIAVGTAALRSASPRWASAVFTLTLGVLATAVLGARYARRQRRPFWAGFALFGWGYATLAFGPWFSEHVGSKLLTTDAIEHVFQRVNPDMGPVPSEAGTSPPNRVYVRHDPAAPSLTTIESSEHFQRIGQSLCALLAGLVGGLVALAFAGTDRPEAS